MRCMERLLDVLGHRRGRCAEVLSVLLPGLENFIMADMRTLPSGVLTGAGASGRYAAHRLFIKEGIGFKTKS